jgi:hypothetical protein
MRAVFLLIAVVGTIAASNKVCAADLPLRIVKPAVSRGGSSSHEERRQLLERFREHFKETR